MIILGKQNAIFTLILEQYQIEDKLRIFPENKQIILLIATLIENVLYDVDDVFRRVLFRQSLFTESG